MRVEKDFLGEITIPANALYGIHSFRARENFPDRTPFHSEWYKALATVKKACYITALDFLEKAQTQLKDRRSNTKYPNVSILNTLVESASECEEGKHSEAFIVPAITGGAGTSINMNINEIIANLSLIKSGFKAGAYQHIDPVEHVNIFQSTNDVVPTALRVAVMQLLNTLENVINSLRYSVEELEKRHRYVLRIAYTQMQEAVPTTFGRLFGSYSDALSRDWWRISKCNERIKVVNLGGSAIGTSIAVPKYFVTEVVRNLHHITGLPVTRGENLSDATGNLDPFVEVHGILKAHAVNLEKIANDIRLLASDIHVSKELSIPQKQLGSTIMPGKVNPVIPEFIISSVYRIYSNDALITGLSGQVCLELNAYLPVIGHALLESLKLLTACDRTLKENLIEGIEIDSIASVQQLMKSPSTATALLPYIGYNRAADLARYMKKHGMDIYEANSELKLVSNEKLLEILKPENLVRGGYRLKDLTGDVNE
jgi:aspartate ammonia-lyase